MILNVNIGYLNQVLSDCGLHYLPRPVTLAISMVTQTGHLLSREREHSQDSVQIGWMPIKI